MAAPKDDQGPPEHAQGNGPPASPPAEQQAPAPQGNARGHEKKAASTQGGGQGEARGQAKSESGDSGDRRGARGQAKAHGRVKGGGQPKETTGGNGESQEHGSSHAKAGKVTLCHATGSETNPYVEITISANALAAHQRHQDGRDIYPAPAGGCPGGTAPSGGEDGDKDKEHGKVTICHATGSETNPYVLITVDEHALPAHTSHQHGEDIVNPTGPCPGATIPSGLGNPPSGIVSPGGGELPAAGQPAAGGLPSTETPAAEAPADEGGVLGVSEERQGDRPDDEGAVLGANQGGGSEGVVQASGDAGTSLPFTGLQLLVLAAVGLLLTLAGFRLRRSAA